MKPKRLIINADDYGWSVGITDGILQAHRAGVVTSASLMANQPASEYAIERLQEFPGLGVGVHLNFCDGRPVSAPSDVPSLTTADGTFYPVDEMVARLKKWQVSPQEIEREFRAQISWIKMRGLQPTRADSHHHLHFYPCAVHAFRRAAKAEGIQCARAPRHEHWPKDGHVGGPYGGRVYRRLLVAAYNEFVQRVVLHGLHLPDSCFVHHPRYRKNPGLLSEGWMVALANVEPGTYELGCHPGLLESGFSETDSFNARREQELQILTDREFRGVIQSNGIELINYRDLLDLPKAGKC